MSDTFLADYILTQDGLHHRGQRVHGAKVIAFPSELRRVRFVAPREEKQILHFAQDDMSFWAK